MIRRDGRAIRAALLLLGAGAIGCGEELGPERFESGRVEGTIRLGGRPIPSGWVEFFPIDGTRGNLRSAPIRADGSFAASGVPAGRVAVRLVDAYGPPIPTSLGPVRFSTFGSFQTPIRAMVPAGTTTCLDIELAAEAERYRRNQEALTRRMDDRDAPHHDPR